MRRWLWILLAAAPATAAALTVTVVVRTAPVKARPQFYAPSVGSAKLGDVFSAGAGKDGWYAVSSGGKDGWLHSSAVTEKRVRLGSGDSVGTGEASADEITLAGKGFNSQVEGAYKKGHPDSDFAAVDAMERAKIPEAAVLKFMEAGGLGGAK